MPAIRVVVTGRVQGVGFRAFVRDVAEGLGLEGEVWNRRDRAVECIAQHEDAGVLAAFAQRLWKGPGRVDAVDAHPIAESPFDGFGIGWTR